MKTYDISNNHLFNNIVMDTYIALNLFLPVELNNLILERIAMINFFNLLIRSGINAEQFCEHLQKARLVEYKTPFLL